MNLLTSIVASRIKAIEQEPAPKQKAWVPSAAQRKLQQEYKKIQRRQSAISRMLKRQGVNIRGYNSFALEPLREESPVVLARRQKDARITACRKLQQQTELQLLGADPLEKKRRLLALVKRLEQV